MLLYSYLKCLLHFGVFPLNLEFLATYVRLFVHYMWDYCSLSTWFIYLLDLSLRKITDRLQTKWEFEWFFLENCSSVKNEFFIKWSVLLNDNVRKYTLSILLSHTFIYTLGLFTTLTTSKSTEINSTFI